MALGHGVSLVPAMARAGDSSPGRVYRSLAGPKPTRTIVLAAHPDHHQGLLVKAFGERLRDRRPG